VNKYYRNLSQDQYAGELTRGYGRLDASISYQVNNHLSVVGTANNLLAEPFNDYRYYNETQYYPSDLRIEGRYFNLGVRFKM
jgi:outer membrane receptor protein involved in Fe transport